MYTEIVGENGVNYITYEDNSIDIDEDADVNIYISSKL